LSVETRACPEPVEGTKRSAPYWAARLALSLVLSLPKGCRSVGDDAGAQDVDPHGLVGVFFHEGDVFVGGGVEGRCQADGLRPSRSSPWRSRSTPAAGSARYEADEGEDGLLQTMSQGWLGVALVEPQLEARMPFHAMGEQIKAGPTSS
jgi:hypothetical protein